MNTNELFTTSDGSHSVLSSTFRVPYHSRHGAISETQHVFIDAGLKSKLSLKEVFVLDIGFGTGLNAYMTYKESITANSKIFYEGIEAYPIDIELVNTFNYPSLLGLSEKVFCDMHELEWSEKHNLGPNFIFHKQLAKFEDFDSSYLFDVIYYDAFAPNAQPSLWETDILAKMYSLLNDNGVLVTYCAQGQFKRNLKTVGFSIEPLPGPMGKREMTRARK